MFYYIGCNLPRLDDCFDGLKCRKGKYCRGLEICSITDELYEKFYKKGSTPCYYYCDNSSGGCIFFDNQEKASEYFEKIKSDKS